MKLISESTIDNVIENLDEDKLSSVLENLFKTQPELMAFIGQANQPLLSDDELWLLEYATILITESVKSQYDLPILSVKELEEAEEKNWELFNNHSEKSFTKILDLFFEGYEQEDLLALVEDSLQPDEEGDVSQVAREIIFIVSKTIIDAFHQALE